MRNGGYDSNVALGLTLVAWEKKTNSQLGKIISARFIKIGVGYC